VNFRTLAVLVLAWVVLTCPAPASTRYMPIAEVKPGMSGVGRAVFNGTAIEEFKADILGVLRSSVVGPQRDLIIARLSGGPLAKTGVIAGMSGSPVYVDGRLIGAVGYSLGSFATEPIAGITPIARWPTPPRAALPRQVRGLPLSARIALLQPRHGVQRLPWPRPRVRATELAGGVRRAHIRPARRSLAAADRPPDLVRRS